MKLDKHTHDYMQTLALAFTFIGKELLKVGTWSADHRRKLIYSGPVHDVTCHMIASSSLWA
jgi:hypothetical protein